MLKHLDLFSGIGGFALAAKMVGGIETAQFCEIDPYCQKVLAKNFPDTPIHGDITALSVHGRNFDLITGGFPCQDISIANANGRGLEGRRSGLFFELMRIVRECRPNYVVLENVAEMLRRDGGRVMGAVLRELSQCGYDAEWQTISAASVGAPHLRKRIFIVAYANSTSRKTPPAQRVEYQEPRTADKSCSLRGNAAYPDGERREKLDPATLSSQEMLFPRSHDKGGSFWAIEPGILRVADGIPNRMDRVRGCGNAIVPQCGAIALQRVLEIEAQLHLCQRSPRHAANGSNLRT